MILPCPSFRRDLGRRRSETAPAPRRGVGPREQGSNLVPLRQSFQYVGAERSRRGDGDAGHRLSQREPGPELPQRVFYADGSVGDW